MVRFLQATTAFALLATMVVNPIMAAPMNDAQTVTVTQIETYTLLIETILIEPTTVTVHDCSVSVTTGKPPSQSSGGGTGSGGGGGVSSAIPSIVSSMGGGGGKPSHSKSISANPHSTGGTGSGPTGSKAPSSSGAAPTASHSTYSHIGSMSMSHSTTSAKSMSMSHAISLSHSASASASATGSAPSGCATSASTLNGRQASFALNTTLPGIPFEVPQSYAGYISINQTNPSDSKQLYFWHTPADASASQDDIIIWFNGGPGCSSMEGLFQENGPFLLPYYNVNSTVQPVLNPWSNHKAAHSVWIDSPGLTGFSKAGDNVPGLKAVAEDIAGFLVNFFQAFPNLQNKRLWLQGESYAGAMIPYMADRIYTDPTMKCKGINLKGIQINDPSWANDNYMESLPIFPYAVKNQQVLNLTDDQIAGFKAKAAPYGLDTYYADNLNYPPKGPLLLPYNWTSDVYDIYDDILGAWNGAHCSSVYNIATECPYTIDPLGYPQAAVNPSYDNFLNNQTGFMQAIRADKVFLECDNSGYREIGEPAPQESIMPYVIEQSEHVVIGGGDLDILLLTMGSQLAIQNMTWSGAQGFQEGLKTDLTTSQGVRGNWITERNLSMIEFYYAGHMIPQDDPEAAFRATQYLIGSRSAP